MNGTIGAANKLNRWGARLLIVIAIVHLVFFTAQAFSLGLVRGWFTGELRSPETLQAEMSQSQAAFWQSLGSFAVPLILLAVLVSVLVKANVPVPGFLGYGLGVWVLVCTVILEPSGFPLGLIPVALLITADQLSRRSRHLPGTNRPPGGDRPASRPLPVP